MRLDRLMGLAGAFGILLASVAARSATVITITSFNQGDSVFLGAGGGGGGANGMLPPINFNDSVGDVSATQTIVKYVGPTSPANTTDALTLQVTATANPGLNGGSASSSLTLAFTMNFGETFSYTRTAPKPTDVQLLFQGKTGQREIAPIVGTGTLGQGDYILKLNDTNATDSFNLQIGGFPAPEPAGLSILMVGASLLACRRRRSGR